MFFPSHLYTGSGSDQKVPTPTGSGSATLSETGSAIGIYKKGFSKTYRLANCNFIFANPCIIGFSNLIYLRILLPTKTKTIGNKEHFLLKQP